MREQTSRVNNYKQLLNESDKKLKAILSGSRFSRICRHIDENGISSIFSAIKENSRRNSKPEITLHDGTLSNLWKYIRENKTFGIITPYRRNDSTKANLNRLNELKNLARGELKLGYFELEGVFFKSGRWVRVKSLCIPSINKRDLLRLGEKLNLSSVIYKDANEFVEIGTSKVSGFGTIIWDYNKSGWHQDVQIDSELAKSFFYKFTKGSYGDGKVPLDVKNTFLLEVRPLSFNEAHSRYVKGIKNDRYVRLL